MLLSFCFRKMTIIVYVYTDGIGIYMILIINNNKHLPQAHVLNIFYRNNIHPIISYISLATV